jgi:hypothetical protein
MTLPLVKSPAGGRRIVARLSHWVPGPGDKLTRNPGISGFACNAGPISLRSVRNAVAKAFAGRLVRYTTRLHRSQPEAEGFAGHREWQAAATGVSRVYRAGRCLRAEGGGAAGPSVAADDARAAGVRAVTRGGGTWEDALPAGVSPRGSRAVEACAGSGHDRSGRRTPGADPSNFPSGAPLTWAMPSADPEEGCWRASGADTPVARWSTGAIDRLASAARCEAGPTSRAVASRSNPGRTTCALAAAPGARATPWSGAASIE